LFYWGDLDRDGLHILATLRHRFPQARSLFMDIGTLEQHHSLATTIIDSRTTDTPEPAELTETELAAYRLCRSRSLRLEQEHIPQALVNKRLADLDWTI
jgi:hypothetical protein